MHFLVQFASVIVKEKYWCWKGGTKFKNGSFVGMVKGFSRWSYLEYLVTNFQRIFLFSTGVFYHCSSWNAYYLFVLALRFPKCYRDKKLAPYYSFHYSVLNNLHPDIIFKYFVLLELLKLIKIIFQQNLLWFNSKFGFIHMIFRLCKLNTHNTHFEFHQKVFLFFVKYIISVYDSTSDVVLKNIESS